MLNRDSKKTKSVSFLEDGKYIFPNLPDSKISKVSGFLSSHLAVANVAYPLLALQYLPEAIHFPMESALPIRWAPSKYFLLLIPVISTLGMIRYSYLAHHPEKVKFPVELSGQNVRRFYCVEKIWLGIKSLAFQCVLLGVAHLFIENSSTLFPAVKSSLVHRLVLAITALTALGSFSIRYFFKVNQ